MSSLRKKACKKSAETKRDNHLGDVTIDDFANTLQIHARPKKAATSVLVEMKQETTMKEEGLAWDEMDKILSQNNTKDSNHEVVSSTSIRKGRRKLKPQEDYIKEEGGIDYPLDIWFILSEYMPPEAVGKFARICKSSYYVTTTAKFWFHLYKTYHLSEFKPNLQPQYMIHRRGLRAFVIRALHLYYFNSLIHKIDDVSYLRQEQPHSLVKRKCTSMWHKEGKLHCYFFFKLKEISKCSRKSSLKQNKKYDTNKTEFIEMLEDVAVNPEEGCKILMVTRLVYSLLPPVIGLVLQTVSMNLMPGYRKYRLYLRFGTSTLPSTLTTEVTLSDIINYRILDWWDPFYPQDRIFPCQMEINSQSESESD